MPILFTCFCCLIQGNCIFCKWNMGSQETEPELWCVKVSAGTTGLQWQRLNATLPATVHSAYSAPLWIQTCFFLIHPNEVTQCTTLHTCALEPKTPGHLPNQRKSSKKTQEPFSKRRKDWNLYNWCILSLISWGVCPDPSVVSSVSLQYTVWVSQRKHSLTAGTKLQIMLYSNSSLNKKYVCNR